MTLGVRLYIVLVISCDISKLQRRIYFKTGDGQTINQTFVRKAISGENVRRVVIDHSYVSEINNVKVKMLEEDAVLPRVYVRYYDGANELKHNCILEENNAFSCETGGRYVVVEGDDVLKEVSSPTLEVFFEKFIGCFKSQRTPERLTRSSPIGCESDCSTPFFGVNSIPKCFCVQNLNELDQVNLNLCNHTSSQFEVIGVGEHFAVYWKHSNKSLGYAEPSWDCIYNLTKCPKCPEGRKGIYCELIDCSVNNGNCGDSECQSISPWKFVTFSNCFCTSGFLAGPIQCEDIDECSSSSNSCDGNTTKCVNTPGSYTCECARGFKRLNEFECEALADHEKEREKEQNKKQDKEQENETDQEKDPKAEMTLVYTGAGLAAFVLLCVVIVYIYFKKKSSTKAQT